MKNTRIVKFRGDTVTRQGLFHARFADNGPLALCGNSVDDGVETELRNVPVTCKKCLVTLGALIKNSTQELKNSATWNGGGIQWHLERDEMGSSNDADDGATE